MFIGIVEQCGIRPLWGRTLCAASFSIHMQTLWVWREQGLRRFITTENRKFMTPEASYAYRKY